MVRYRTFDKRFARSAVRLSKKESPGLLLRAADQGQGDLRGQGRVYPIRLRPFAPEGAYVPYDHEHNGNGYWDKQ